jgi:Leucine-rich repeat (LRR) protein
MIFSVVTASVSLKLIPIEIKQLEKLHMLKLANNHLSDLPKQFSQLTNLSKLDISSNHFKVLPISSLPDNLHALDVSYNQIAQMKTDFRSALAESKLTFAARAPY